jgi:uncharacterized repeat protein (TIGR01451 family)
VTLGRRTAGVVALALVLLGLGGVPARATVFCVPGPCPGGMPQATVASAINQSNANPDHDTIEIAAGSYHEDFPQVQSGKPVDIVGAGPSQTVLRPFSQGDSLTTLQINDPNSTVSNLGIQLPTGSSNNPGNFETGLALAGSASPGSAATNVAVTAPNAVKSSSGVSLFGGSTRLSGGTVTLPLASPNFNTGVLGQGTVDDSRIAADVGVSDTALVRRTRIDADAFGINAADGTQRYEDVTVVIVAGAPPNAIGLSASPVSVPTDVTARHLTLIGTGDPTSIGAVCASGVLNNSGSLSIDGVVFRGFGKDLSRTAPSNSANISIDYSDYDPAKVTDTNSGGSGSITRGPHNVNVDPGFVSSDPSNPAAFRLLATSPVLDAGNPSLPGDESTTDGDGAPRVTAGRGTAPAVSDIGAFEFQPHAPTAVATGPGTGQIGQVLTFDASGSSDPDPGDSITFGWTFDDGAVAFGPKVSHAFASPGSHRATVTVIDLSHRTATASVDVTVPPRILSLTKSADHKSVRRRARAGFTIAAINGSDVAIALSSLSDRLPSGFRYVRGSATLNGKPVTDPRVRGRTLTWSSPVRRVKKKKHRRRTLGARIALSAPAHGKLRLHLLTTAAKKPGKYTNRAGAVAGPTVAVATGAASVTVRVRAH